MADLEKELLGTLQTVLPGEDLVFHNCFPQDSLVEGLVSWDGEQEGYLGSRVFHSRRMAKAFDHMYPLGVEREMEEKEPDMEREWLLQ